MFMEQDKQQELNSHEIIESGIQKGKHDHHKSLVKHRQAEIDAETELKEQKIRDV